MQIADVSGEFNEPSRFGATLAQTVAGVVDTIAEADFPRAALMSLDALIGVGSWSVYQRFADAPPRLYLSASNGIPDTTRDCFSIYHAGLYRRDATFDSLAGAADLATNSAADSAAERTLVTRVRASEIGPREHRERIYESHGMVDRMSVLSCDARGGLLAVNLYRHEHQGCYSNADCRAFRQIAAPVLAAVRRHVKLTVAVTRVAPVVDEDRFGGWLSRHCPALSEREREVCVRLLQGMSYDGIASDLGLSVSTVKTYRLRAFERMGIHFRSELFSAYVGAFA